MGNDIDASPSRSEGASNCVAYNGSNGDTANCTGFTPIGNGYTNSFTGSFDGAGHKITKLYIKRPSRNQVGLFGYAVNSAEIKNVGVTDAYVEGQSQVGGLIGWSAGFGTSVSNSYATGVVTGTGYNVGGLIGNSSGSVSNSYATGAVTGTGNNVGGLIGYAYGASVSVSNSYATGAVTGTSYSVGGLIGGLTGSSSGSVSNSYATGAVMGTSYSVGGLIGQTSGSVSNSYATGAVTGPGDEVGGLVGSSGSGSVGGKNYFVDASGGSNGIGSGSCSGTCTRKTAVDIAALSSTSVPVTAPVSDWLAENWNFGTATQFPAVLYSGGGCETIATNDINSNDGDASKVDCGDIIKGQRLAPPRQPLGISGSASNPIIISTYAQLKTVKNGLDKHYRLGNNIDASPSRSEGASNCVAYNGSNGDDATCTGFTPIGNTAKKFTGSFDGAGHKITSLYINRPSTDRVGLFGYTRYAEIKNIGVTDAYIAGRVSVGGLIGSSEGSSVSNSYATGAVTGTGKSVGGLIGYSRGTVSNSYATGAVTGGRFVGGLIGQAYSASVSNSYAMGAVMGTGSSSCEVGGLIGWAFATVSNSYATGTVMGKVVRFAGGLIGVSHGSVTGKNYFVDASGGSNGLGDGSCSGTCTRKTAVEIAALTSTSGWTTGSSGNWNFGTTTQFPAVLYSGGGCETISGTNNINSNDGDANIPDCGDLLPGQPIAVPGSVAVRLAVPQNLHTSRATPIDGNYTISWNAVSASAGGYVLEQSIDNGTNWTAVMLSSDNATSHDFENREGETNYKYRVRACVTTGCIAGTSESSPWATSMDNFVQVVYPAITAIALSETTDIDGAYSFTWNKLGNASKYQIRKRSLATPLATERTSDHYQAQQAAARLSQSGQLGHRSYGYKIRACNS